MEHPSASSGWTKDPWGDAFERLPEASQVLLTRARQCTGIASASINTVDIVKETIEVAKQRISDSEANEWMFKIGRKEFVPRHFLDRIIDWLQKFIAIGDVAVAFDPVHAALPWAAVRFLLQSAVLNREQTQGILQIVEKVTYLVQQGRFYEATYNPTTMKLLDESGTTWLSDLWKDLVDLYEVILTSLVYACRKLELRTSGYVLWGIFRPEEIQNHLSSLKDHSERLEKRSDVCHKAHSQQVLNKWLASCEEANHGIAGAALNYVSGIPFKSHHEFVQRLRAPGTCGWILQTDKYQDWKKWIFKIAILYGPPGVGKTFLISRVIDDLKLPSEPEASAHGVAYFYCNRNEVDRTKPENVLRSYVRQLAMPRGHSVIRKDILRLRGDLSREGRQLDLFRARELLMQLIDAYATTTLVLDAMDECDPESRQDLLDTLDDVVKAKHPTVRLFLSSRRDADIRRHFEDRPKIEVEASCSQHDIGVFVETKLQSVKNFRVRPPELRQHIKDTLMAKNEGMFQWVALQLDQLSRCCTTKEMEDRLGKLPRGLTATYQDIWSQILQSPWRRDRAPRVIQWMIVSDGKLETDFLAEIMEVDPTSNVPDAADEELADVAVISDIFYNLLIHDSLWDRWRFCHLSAREYFEERHDGLRHANAFVGACCLKLLVIPPKSRSLFSATHYARGNWFNHLRTIDDTEENTTQRVKCLLKMFLGSLSTGSPSFNNWVKEVSPLQLMSPKKATDMRFSVQILPWLYPRRSPEEIVRAPMLAACYSIPGHLLSDWWLETELDLDICGSDGKSLLELSLRGRTSVWKYLLRRNVSVDNGSMTPLRVAIEMGNTEAIDALLASGADINRLAQRDDRTCLSEAIYQSDGETVMKLVDHGANINKAEVNKSSADSRVLALMPPLDYALSERQWSMAHTLLDLGARTCLKDRYTIVMEMVKTQESIDLLRRFLDMGETLPPLGKFMAANVMPNTMNLKEAIRIIQWLIGLGAGVDDTDNGKSPGALAAAVSNRCVIPLLEVLLDNGANIDLVTDHQGEESALCAAVELHNNETLRFLLDDGANPDQGTDSVTPLIRCFLSHRDLCDSAELLLYAGAQVNAICRECRYPTALIAACSTDDLKGVELLIEWGADVNLSSGPETPLSEAAKKGHYQIVKTLLENGADPNYSYAGDISSPLAIAAYSGHFKVTKLLLEAGVSPNRPLSGWFRNAIQAALRGVTKSSSEYTESSSENTESAFEDTESSPEGTDLHHSRLRVVGLLLDMAKSSPGDTDLNDSRLRVIHLLLQDRAGSSPENTDLDHSRLQVIESLLQDRAESSPEDTDLDHSRLQVIESLLQDRAELPMTLLESPDPPTESSSEDTNLDHSRLRVIELLLQHGAEPPMTLLKCPEPPAFFFRPRSGRIFTLPSSITGVLVLPLFLALVLHLGDQTGPASEIKD
ncbi:hypothetical protein FDECE_12608 [Fusarium decemcellulare]|nr:hypothetical protein FDECE_12608 [Fusarium decemcellulare]